MHPINIDEAWQGLAADLAADRRFSNEYRRFEHQQCPLGQRLKTLSLQILAGFALVAMIFGVGIVTAGFAASGQVPRTPSEGGSP